MDNKRFPSTPHPPIRLEITLSAEGAACQIPSHSYRCPSAAAANTNETKRSPVRRNNSQTALTSTFPPTVIKKVPAISSKQAAAVSTRSRPVPRVPTPPAGMDPGNNPPPTFRSSVAALHSSAGAGRSAGCQDVQGVTQWTEHTGKCFFPLRRGSATCCQHGGEPPSRLSSDAIGGEGSPRGRSLARTRFTSFGPEHKWSVCVSVVFRRASRSISERALKGSLLYLIARKKLTVPHVICCL